jgi:hypothetical protein
MNIYLKYISVSRRISLSITQRICHQHCEPNWYGSGKQTDLTIILLTYREIILTIYSLTCFMTGWLTKSRGISRATMILDLCCGLVAPASAHGRQGGTDKTMVGFCLVKNSLTLSPSFCLKSTRPAALQGRGTGILGVSCPVTAPPSYLSL